MSITYSNPRLEAIVDGWPFGGKFTTATFKIEQHPTRGERTTRTTISPKTGKPAGLKVLTFSKQQRIVDGSDGKTYIACNNRDYGFITIYQGNMQFQAEDPVWPKDPRFAEMLKLFA
jgi:hypothetical protein